MKPIPTAATVLVLLAVLLAEPFRGDLSLLRSAVSAIAAVALVLGVWIVPVVGCDRPSPAWDSAKSRQLWAGAGMAWATQLLVTDNPGVSAMVGIIGAMLLGEWTARRGRVGSAAE